MISPQNNILYLFIHPVATLLLLFVLLLFLFLLLIMISNCEPASRSLLPSPYFSLACVVPAVIKSHTGLMTTTSSNNIIVANQNLIMASMLLYSHIVF